MLPGVLSLAQNNDTIPIPEELIVNYTAPPKRYYIANIDVTGVEGTMYEDQKFVQLAFPGYPKVRDTDTGDDISNAIKRFWRQGLFSDVKILQTKIKEDSVWLEIRLTDRPRVSDVRYTGMKRGAGRHRGTDWLRERGTNHPAPDRAEVYIKSYFDEKGFGEAEVRVLQHPTPPA